MIGQRVEGFKKGAVVPIEIRRKFGIKREVASIDEAMGGVGSGDLDGRGLRHDGEAMLDACRHVVSAKEWGPAKTYGEYLDLMRERNALSRDVAASIRRYVAWRNILTHRYIDVDHGRLYRDAKGLAVLAKEFERQIARFLERETE